MAADHKYMVKYESSEDENYKKVVRTLSSILRSASEKVEENWRIWKRIKGLPPHMYLRLFSV